MNKPKFETTNLTAENVTKIAEIFPGVVTEGKVNFDLLRSLLGDEVYGDEAYEFTWVGKRAAIAEAGRPIRKTLRPCPEESKNWDTTENLYIEGDNLDVLKLLQESYLGKVKMIYIDPPYNTGNDFIYRDNFTRDKDEYDQEAGVYDEDGDRLLRNTESNGRFHSDWCSMMYPRLVLARNLLRDDGVIFISIDDNEVAQARKICDEVFGESNFIAQLIWHSRQNKDNRNISGVSIDHEYIICYTKQSGQRSFRGTERKTDQYTNPDNDPRGAWTSANMVGLATADARPNLHYDLINPNTGIKYRCPPKGWRYDKKTMRKLIDEDRILWPETPEGRPRKKTFLADLSDTLPGFSSILEDGLYTNTATKEITFLFGGHWFDFPKPVNLLRIIIEQGAPVASNDIILDFFSGSATTAHAVMQLNAEDGGNRKFIMVQLPEPCDEKAEAYKAGYKNICEIGKERIRRAGEKIKEENKEKEGIENLDIGFRVLKLDSTNMKDVYYAAGEYTQDLLALMEDNIKEDRTDMDLLYACLLDWGLPLSLPHKTELLNTKGEILPNSELGTPNSELFKVHTYNDGDLIACFDKHISEAVIKEIARRQPLRAVFRDSSFASSPEKINVEEIFKLLAPNTSVRVL